MKKIFFYFTTVLAAFSMALPACKKITHSNHPTPDNYRLWSYTKTTNQSIIFPPTLTPVLSENYRFVYDGGGKVAQIFFTSNDSNKLKVGMGDLSIVFSYILDTIYKTSTDLKTSTVKQRDTFIVNSLGQIKEAYFPNEVHFFSYYGKLLANETVTYRDTGAMVTAQLSYTSNNGDWLNRLHNGNLIAGFPDSALRPYILPGDLQRDTILSFPLDVTWTVFPVNAAPIPVVHAGVSTYTDMFSGYPGNAIVMTAIDANGVTTRPVYFPAGYAAQQFYQIYDFLSMRTGDYLQLNSFTTYGVNIYQNVHMVKSMSSPHGTTNIAYTIDGESKVTHSSVIIKDSLTHNTISEAYDLQYETF